MHGGPAAAGLRRGRRPRSVAPGVVVGLLMGHWARLPQCTTRSAGGAHAPRTRLCSACCLAVALAQGCTRAQASPAGAGGWRAWAGDSVAGAGAAGRHGRSSLAARLVCALARGLGAGASAASAVLGADRAAGAAWAGAAALPTAGDATAGPAVTGATGGGSTAAAGAQPVPVAPLRGWHRPVPRG